VAHYFLYGAGGHGRVVASVCQALSHSYIFGDDKILRYDLPKEGFVTIGNNRSRQRVAQRLFVDSKSFGAALIHPRAFHSELLIGAGSVVMAGAVVQTHCTIGRHVIVNTNASVDHDCEIGDYSHIAPGAVLCGGVSIGEGTLVGAGAVIIPGVKIGKWQLVKAGTVVKEDVPDGQMAEAHA
jgi:sugar O-acyltransferase (sialic acid O-acetyltransferase NeuD family)